MKLKPYKSSRKKPVAKAEEPTTEFLGKTPDWLANVEELKVDYSKEPDYDPDQLERAFAVLGPKRQLEIFDQRRVIQHLKQRYPNVMFHTSLDGEIRGAMQGKKISNMQHSPGFPDLQVFHPHPFYSGLALELKVETPYKIKGGLKKSEHLEAQQKWLTYLESCGFCAMFATKELAINYIDEFIAGEIIFDELKH